MDQLLTGRADEGLAEFLRYENVAWYQDGAVRILDRRKYPTETTYVSCTSVEEVRDAIHDMVTQSGGVKIAAFQALRLHAHQAGGLNSGEEIEGLRHAKMSYRPLVLLRNYNLIPLE